MRPYEKLVEALRAGIPQDAVYYFTHKDVEDMTSEEVVAFNMLLSQNAPVKPFRMHLGPGGYEFTASIIDTGHVFSGAPDARQSASSAPDDVGPFRNRYRKLNYAEIRHHDTIKDIATSLWNAINDIPNMRAEDKPSGEVLRDMALARTHLEDSVMRAVRALTA